MDEDKVYTKADVDAINTKPVIRPAADKPAATDPKGTALVLHRLRLRLPW